MKFLMYFERLFGRRVATSLVLALHARFGDLGKLHFYEYGRSSPFCGEY